MAHDTLVAAGAGADEAARLAALRRYRILDTLPEQAYDDIVRVAGMICGVPISLVSLIDVDRQWFKARRGLADTETPRDIAFCDHAIRTPELVFVVEDARLDPRFSDNPLVTGDLGIRFYAGMPLVTYDGHALGTVCVIDQQPRQLGPEQEEGLRALARMAAAMIELRGLNLEHQRMSAERDVLNSSLVSYQRELEERNAQLQASTERDALTGLTNRAGLARIRADAHSGRLRLQGPYAIAVVDIDHFKRINDTYGHAAGDEVLRAVAAEIQRGVRGGDIAARYGGEEFLVLLPDTGVDGAAQVVERIRDGVANLAGLPTTVTVSAGVASGIIGRDSSETLFRYADQALYLAKRNGRNRVERAEY